MNESVLDKPIVLKLNRLWQRIGWATPREAFTAMCGGMFGGTPPAKGLSITTDENGELIEGIALDWDEWVKLPIRDCDFSISTGRGLVRVPSVIVSPEFDKMPLKQRKFSPKAVRERDKNRCAVTGRILAEGEGNMAHIKARAHGGTRTWENIVYMDKKLNSLQGTRTPEEMGWNIPTPKAPNPIPACAVPTEAKLPDQTKFI